MTLARRLPCRQRLGAPALLAVAGILTAAFDLRVVGLLVVMAGFGMAGHGLARAIVPARTGVDRLLASLTFGVAVLALVAEALSLVSLLGSTTAWIAGAVLCGIVGSLLPRHLVPGTTRREAGFRTFSGAMNRAPTGGCHRRGAIHRARIGRTLHRVQPRRHAASSASAPC